MTSSLYIFCVHMAADNALHQCYRSTMQLALDHGLRRLAVSCIYPPRKRYPPKEGDLVCLRTIRRCLERHPTAVDQARAPPLDHDQMQGL